MIIFSTAGLAGDLLQVARLTVMARFSTVLRCFSRRRIIKHQVTENQTCCEEQKSCHNGQPCHFCAITVILAMTQAAKPSKRNGCAQCAPAARTPRARGARRVFPTRRCRLRRGCLPGFPLPAAPSGRRSLRHPQTSPASSCRCWRWPRPSRGRCRPRS